MYERIHYLLVGIFVLITSLLLVYFIFWLSKSDISLQNYNRYYILFDESVDGLNKDAIVKLNGVNVGRVEELILDEKYLPKVKVAILIKKSIKIKDDMYAVLKTQGVTGIRYIDIKGGVSKNVVVPNSNNSFIKSKKSIIADFSSNAPKALNELIEFSKKLDKLLSDKNIDNFSKILENGNIVLNKASNIEDNISKIISSIKVDSLINDLNNTLNNYNLLAKNGNILLNNLNQNLPNLINNIDKTTKELSKLSKKLRFTINRGDYNLKKILKPAIVDLKELTIRYIELSDDLKALVNNPVNAIFAPKSLPKGPGE